MRTGYEVGTALAFFHLVQFPDNARHCAVDAAVVEAKGKRRVEVGSSHVWPPLVAGFLSRSAGYEYAFQSDALPVGINDFLENAHDARMVDQKFSGTRNW